MDSIHHLPHQTLISVHECSSGTRVGMRKISHYTIDHSLQTAPSNGDTENHLLLFRRRKGFYFISQDGGGNSYLYGSKPQGLREDGYSLYHYYNLGLSHFETSYFSYNGLGAGDGSISGFSFLLSRASFHSFFQQQSPRAFISLHFISFFIQILSRFIIQRFKPSIIMSIFRALSSGALVEARRVNVLVVVP